MYRKWENRGEQKDSEIEKLRSGERDRETERERKRDRDTERELVW